MAFSAFNWLAEAVSTTHAAALNKAELALAAYVDALATRLAATQSIEQTEPTRAGVAFSVTQDSTVNKAHAVTIFYRAKPGTEGGVAANIISNATTNSAVFVTGVNTTKATIKLTHTNESGTEEGDKEASALNLNIVKGTEAGTACQGLRIGSEDATPNSKGSFITAVRGTGGSTKNLWRLLATGVMEWAEAEGSEPKTATTKPESGKVKLFPFNGHLYLWLSANAEPTLVI